MSKLIELRNSRAETIEEMESILDAAKKEERDFSDEEETRYDELEQTLDTLAADIDKEQKKEDRSALLAAEKENLKKIEKRSPRIEIGVGDEGEFRNLGEFFATVAGNPTDNRLQELRVQQMKNGVGGGFAVPDQFRETLMMVDPQMAIVRPRATVIPAGEPPDATLTMPALDQGSGQNMYGGVQVYHQGESVTLTESTLALRQVELKPKKLTAYMTASNELLNNWSAASMVIPSLMQKAMTGAEDTDFLQGDGVNKSQGVINSPAAIQYSRATANQISFADVLGMYARHKVIGGQPAWVTSQTCIPQLAQIADSSSANIWVQSAAPGLPPSLMGFPVLFADRSPALGSKGDLMLVDLTAYLVKDGSGPTVAVSEHFRFQNDEVAFRIVKNVDGQSWLNEPIQLEGSTANTVSPFVVLDTP